MTYEVQGWGIGELWAQDELLVWHELPRPGGPPLASSHFEPTAEAVTRGMQDSVGSVTLSSIAQRLFAYFARQRPAFDGVELDLDWCTPFQRAVVSALRTVPYGEIVTYGELAALAGHPNAQRAAGSVCAHNRYPVLVPCHRVVSANGLGSYGSLGVEYKRRLLELEGVFRGRS